MKKILLLISLFVLTNQAHATEIRLRAMGGMRLAVPDIEAQVNLYHLADNIAWLKVNDTTDWSRYTALSQNESGRVATLLGCCLAEFFHPVYLRAETN